ncbi:MAG: phosphoenolpyruvate carboxykinase domain-containing protein, partial [Candidatus Entotheonellia bacterium]
ADGGFLWPGFGQNVRVLKWILGRVRGEGKAIETPIGLTPTPDALDLDGLDLPRSTLEELLRVDRDEWSGELEPQRKFLERFGERLPREIWHEHEQLVGRLNRVSVAPTPGGNAGGR